MDCSYARRYEVTCPHCQQPAHSDIWLIVDTVNRPDLLQSIIDGNLNQFKCDHCHQTVEADAPLLVYQATHQPPLLFSPAQKSTATKQGQHLRELVSQLLKAIETEDDEWVEEGLRRIPRQHLPTTVQQTRIAQGQPPTTDDPAAKIETPKPVPIKTNSVPLLPLSQTVERLMPISLQLVQLTQRQEMPRRVELCQQALALLSKEQTPELWAGFNVELGNSLYENPLGDRAENLEQAIGFYQQALSVRTEEAMPVEWAEVTMNLADAYLKRIQGDRAENLEQAIGFYQQALSVRTKEAMPVEWAEATMNLANAYRNRIQGDRAENLEQAFGFYQQALSVMAKEAMPVEWATTAQHLMSITQQLEQLTQRQEMPRRVELCQQGLALLSKEQDSELWAGFNVELGNSLYQNPLGDRVENLEQAIGFYQQALSVRTKEAMPVEWATTTMNLALAYTDRIQGDRAENLEQAIGFYQQALSVMTKEAMSVEWAEATMALANAYYFRIQGDRVENLEQAIGFYQQALSVRTKEAMPVEWATTTMNLALAYTDRIQGDRVENLEQAIGFYQQALSVMTKEVMPIEWATTTMNLATAYVKRIRGDRAENLEQAIGFYQQALSVRTKEVMPVEWAEATMNLATAYVKRIRGDRVENLEQAIGFYQQALSVMTKEAMPIEWARTTMNLAIAYIRRIRGDRAENLEQAIGFYQQALSVMTKEAMPVEWARTTMNLALAYTERIQCDRAENLEQAIGFYQQALSVMTKEAMPVEWATTTMNLAIAYLKRIQGDRAENLEQAIGFYQQALSVRTKEAMPLDYISTQYGLGLAYQTATRWQSAYDTFAAAIEVVDRLRLEIQSGDDAKQKLAEEWNLLYQAMVYTCLQLQKPTEALDYVERSKARNLIERLANRDLCPSEAVPQPIVHQLNQLRQKIQAEQQRLQSEEIARLRPADGESPKLLPIPDRSQLNQLQAELNQLIQQDIQPYDPGFSLTQTVEPIQFHQIQALLPDRQTALIEWYITDASILVFLIAAGGPQPKVLVLDEAKQTELVDWTNRYLAVYYNESTQWRQHLAEELHHLADILQIHTLLSCEELLRCDRLILIPHRFLHLLPLHALPIPASPDYPTPSPCLLDRFPRGISYAPSCQLLQLTQQSHSSQLTHLLAIQNPTNDLPFTDVEVPAIRQFFKPHDEAFVKTDAKKTALTDQPLHHAHCLHFACHGYFNLENPLKSALILADAKLTTAPAKDGERYLHRDGKDVLDLEKCLTLEDLFNRAIDLSQVRLTTLSACETGVIDPKSTSDEYIGLPSGFLYVGSPSVVSSLWTVNDLSTSFLMIKFYAYVKDGMTVALALNQAQRWLRQVTKSELEREKEKLSLNATQKFVLNSLLFDKEDIYQPFENPFYWAAFCAIGQ